MGASEGLSVLVDPKAPSLIFSGGIRYGRRIQLGAELTSLKNRKFLFCF